MIELSDDFRDILVELYDAGAHFVVLGGHAVAFHGHPRATKDLGLSRETRASKVAAAPSCTPSSGLSPSSVPW